MAPDEIGRTVCREFDRFIADHPSTARWNKLRQQLAIWFAAIDAPSAFAGMLWVLENCDKYQYQELAGELLRGRLVPLEIPLSDFVRRIAPRINPSAGSVSRYLRDLVGGNVAMDELNAQFAVTEDERATVGLRILGYWLGQHPLG